MGLGLAWMRSTLQPLTGEEVLAGQLFRPRGAWGDDARHMRRFLWRRLGIAGRGLHPLERRMWLINFAAVTPSRLVLFRGRGGWSSLHPTEQIAAWPLAAVSARWTTRRVAATHTRAAGNGRFARSDHYWKIAIATFAIDGDQPLQVDFPSGELTDRLRAGVSLRA